VADEAPDVGVRGVVQAAVVEIAVEAGVIDGVDGPQTHGDRGELPELGHETGMRVGGEATAHLLSEQVEVLLVEPALQEGPGVEAGGGVTLEVDVVAATGCAASPEEVVEADLVEGGGRGEGREMAPDPLDVVVGLGDHHRGVPSDVPADAALDVAVTRELGLVLQGDGVDVRGRDGAGYSEAGALRPLQQLGEEVAGPGGPDVLDDLVERLLPLLSLDWVDVGKLVYELDADRFAKIARHEARLVHGGCHRTGRRSCDRSHGMTISRKRGPASNWRTCPASSIITRPPADGRRHAHATAGGGTSLSASPRTTRVGACTRRTASTRRAGRAQSAAIDREAEVTARRAHGRARRLSASSTRDSMTGIGTLPALWAIQSRVRVTRSRGGSR